MEAQRGQATCLGSHSSRNGSTEMLGTLPKTTQFIQKHRRFANKCLISHSSEVEAKGQATCLKSHSLELEAQRHRATQNNTAQKWKHRRSGNFPKISQLSGRSTEKWATLSKNSQLQGKVEVRQLA